MNPECTHVIELDKQIYKCPFAKDTNNTTCIYHKLMPNPVMTGTAVTEYNAADFEKVGQVNSHELEQLVNTELAQLISLFAMNTPVSQQNTKKTSNQKPNKRTHAPKPVTNVTPTTYLTQEQLQTSLVDQQHTIYEILDRTNLDQHMLGQANTLLEEIKTLKDGADDDTKKVFDASITDLEKKIKEAADKLNIAQTKVHKVTPHIDESNKYIQLRHYGDDGKSDTDMIAIPAMFTQEIEKDDKFVELIERTVWKQIKGDQQLEHPTGDPRARKQYEAIGDNTKFKVGQPVAALYHIQNINILLPFPHHILDQIEADVYTKFIYMGLWNSSNIVEVKERDQQKVTGIAMDTFRCIEVHKHGDKEYGTKDAQFQIINPNNIAYGWLIAVCSTDIYITFMIIYPTWKQMTKQDVIDDINKYKLQSLGKKTGAAGAGAGAIAAKNTKQTETVPYLFDKWSEHVSDLTRYTTFLNDIFTQINNDVTTFDVKFAQIVVDNYDRIEKFTPKIYTDSTADPDIIKLRFANRQLIYGTHVPVNLEHMLGIFVNKNMQIYAPYIVIGQAILKQDENETDIYIAHMGCYTNGAKLFHYTHVWHEIYLAINACIREIKKENLVLRMDMRKYPVDQYATVIHYINSIVSKPQSKIQHISLQTDEEFSDNHLVNGMSKLSFNISESIFDELPTIFHGFINAYSKELMIFNNNNQHNELIQGDQNHNITTGFMHNPFITPGSLTAPVSKLTIPSVPNIAQISAPPPAPPVLPVQTSAPPPGPPIPNALPATPPIIGASGMKPLATNKHKSNNMSKPSATNTQQKGLPKGYTLQGGAGSVPVMPMNVDLVKARQKLNPSSTQPVLPDMLTTLISNWQNILSNDTLFRNITLSTCSDWTDKYQTIWELPETNRRPEHAKWIESCVNDSRKYYDITLKYKDNRRDFIPKIYTTKNEDEVPVKLHLIRRGPSFRKRFVQLLGIPENMSFKNPNIYIMIGKAKLEHNKTVKDIHIAHVGVYNINSIEQTLQEIHLGILACVQEINQNNIVLRMAIDTYVYGSHLEIIKKLIEYIDNVVKNNSKMKSITLFTRNRDMYYKMYTKTREFDGVNISNKIQFSYSDFGDIFDNLEDDLHGFINPHYKDGIISNTTLVKGDKNGNITTAFMHNPFITPESLSNPVTILKIPATAPNLT